MGSDLSIARNARVSYDAAWRAGEDTGSDTRLINYMYANGHTSPFEAVTVTFEVRAPIFVFRQWHRHRTQSYNEISARYRQLPDDYYIPDIDQITTQHASNKQMRTRDQHPEAQKIQDMIEQANRSSLDVYNQLIEMGAPRELARSVMPVGTYSHMFATFNPHNGMRFLAERLHDHAQYEIFVYAKVILEMLYELFPVTIRAFVNGLKNNYEREELQPLLHRIKTGS
jgi:thymidylate synthase (FAD)